MHIAAEYKTGGCAKKVANFREALPSPLQCCIFFMTDCFVYNTKILCFRKFIHFGGGFPYPTLRSAGADYQTRGAEGKQLTLFLFNTSPRTILKQCNIQYIMFDNCGQAQPVQESQCYILTVGFLKESGVLEK